MHHMIYRLNIVLLCVLTLGGYELFDRYPQLKQQVPHVVLGDLPTPVMKLSKLGAVFGHDALYMKRDDLSGALVNGQRIFGGNKVRKLEILLADALRIGASSVVTVGCAGSNHALATAVYASLLGLKAYLVLMPQINSSIVRRNLLLDQFYDAQIVYVHNRAQRCEQVAQLKREHGDALYTIPVGGSVPLGCVGYVNAAFELKKQIDQGLLPEPDVIYVAIGSGGTTAGLLLGLKAAGLHSVLRPIAVDYEKFPVILKNLVPATNQLLHAADAAFPLFDWMETSFGVVTDFIGGGYGVCSKQAREAMVCMYQHEGIMLEGTYSAKACAALIHDLASGALHDKKVLFWNTFSVGDFMQETKTVDYRKLPVALHDYFTRVVARDYINEQEPA